MNVREDIYTEKKKKKRNEVPQVVHNQEISWHTFEVLSGPFYDSIQLWRETKSILQDSKYVDFYT